MDINEIEYKRLCEKFGVSNKKAKSGCIDITSGDYSNRVRRWAALLITRNMLKKLIQIKKRIETHVSNTTGMITEIQEGPVLTADDLFLALFPVPASPLILPWHSGAKIDNSLGWVKNMMRWKDQKNIGRDRGDLALSVRDLLAGEGWKPEGPYGLTNSERLVLRGFALEDSDLTEADWRAYNRANLVLWGKQQEVEHEQR